MAVSLKISDAHAKELIGFYEQKVSLLSDQLAEIANALNEYEDALKQLRGEVNLAKTVSGVARDNDVKDKMENNYDVKWSWIKKATFLLKKAGRPLTTTEIVDAILKEYEPNNDKPRASIVSSMSAVLSLKYTANKIIRKEYKGHNYYALPEMENYVFADGGDNESLFQ